MGERRRLGVQDALWLEMDRPNNLMVVDSVVWTTERLDWTAVRAVLRERLGARYPVFRSRAVRDEDGTWWWDDPGEEVLEALMEDHLTVVELDDPDDPRELQALVARHRTAMLDRERPLWQAIAVDRYLDGSALLLRTHHAIADGMRMVQLAMSLFDASPEGGPILGPGVVQHAAKSTAAGVAEPRPPGQDLPSSVRAGAEGAARRAAAAGQAAAGTLAEALADPAGYALDATVAGTRAVARTTGGAVAWAASGSAELARQAARNPVGAAHGLVTSAWATASEAAASARRTALPGRGPLVDVFSAAPGDVDTVRKLLLGTRNDATLWTGTAGGDKGVAWSAPLSLAEVKEVARAHGCTVNDVLVTCVAGALHDYLAAHDARCGSVTFMVPVNLRPLDLSLPDDLGNGFALVQLELPTDEPDLVRVLEVAHRRMDRIKHGHEAAVAFRLQEAIAGLNRSLYEASVDLFASRTLGTLTNVPGPPVPVYLAGSRVAGIVGWAPVSGDQPMSFTIHSYAGEVVVGIACDTGLVPDHEQIVEGFGDAFARLLAVTRAAAPPAR